MEGRAIRVNQFKEKDDAPSFFTRERKEYNDTNKIAISSRCCCSWFSVDLAWSVDEECLRKEFASCGEIANLFIMKDKKTHQSKGQGIIRFETEEGMKKALEMNGKELKGRPVSIRQFLPKEQYEEKRAAEKEEKKEKAEKKEEKEKTAKKEDDE